MKRARSVEITMAIVTSILLGALNSVLSKIKADQLQIFDGMVSGIMNAIGYMVGYFPILYFRYRKGIVTREMVRFMYVDAGLSGPIKGAQKLIVVGGLADEAGQVLSSIATPYVSIVASALLNQTSSLWTTLTSYFFLNARYTLQEFAGIFVALAGATVEVVAIRDGEDSGTQSSMAVLVLIAAIAPAISFVLKEKCFRIWKSQSLLGDPKEPLDVWVVASAAALWSFLWAPATSLVISLLKKPQHMTVGRYASDSFRCFANRIDYENNFIDDDDPGDATKACTYAWQFWVLYMTTNVAYNISIYRVVRLTSALTQFVCGKLVTPTAVAFSLIPWPIIGAGTVYPLQGLSLAIILVGVAIFRHGTVLKYRMFSSEDKEDEAATLTTTTTHSKKKKKNIATPGVCCWPLCAYKLEEQQEEEEQGGPIYPAALLETRSRGRPGAGSTTTTTTLSAHGNYSRLLEEEEEENIDPEGEEEKESSM